MSCYFESKAAAVEYYRLHNEDTKDVEDKINRGEVKIGKPPLKRGQELFINKETRRYIIQGGE